MTKEETMLQKHLLDLAERTYQNGTYTFSNFLSLPQQDMLYSMQKELAHIPYSLFGGNEQSERKIVRFGSLELLGYEENYPIICIKIEPLIEKFADALTHRDFLGALMNLGIEREMLGDIMIEKKSAYLFCHQRIAEFIMEHLDQVKHTHVKCTPVTEETAPATREPVEREILTASLRIDAVIVKMYNISRNQSIQLFQAKKVYINGRIQESNSYFLKEGESVTVRGFGKFDFIRTDHITKKGKTAITILNYE